MYSDRIIANLKRSAASRLGLKAPPDSHPSIPNRTDAFHHTQTPVPKFNILEHDFLSGPMYPDITDNHTNTVFQDNDPFHRGPKHPDTRNNHTISVFQDNDPFHRGPKHPDTRNNHTISVFQDNDLYHRGPKHPDNPKTLDEVDDEPDISPAEVSIMRKVLRTQLVQSSHEVEILRQDSRSPLHSVKTFDQLNLSPELKRGVYAMGFNAPSKIQETTLPTLIADPPVNMIAQSQSGTGKTAAFVLSCLSRVKTELAYPQVLILSPTNELAFQTGQVAKQMGQFCTGIKFRYVVKGQTLEKGHRLSEQVLIGTPGKVYDWSRKRGFFDLHRISCFVLDEADIMISLQGHLDQCLQIHRYMSQECQTMLFSATYTSEVMEFAEMIIVDPIIIRLKREEETLINVKQYYVECYTMGQKYVSIRTIYGVLSIGQAIIFCKTKRTAAWLGQKMVDDGHSVAYLSSELDIEKRLHVLSSFREGKEKVLITTNVCARGIDVEQVTIVINFDLPVTLTGRADCETYLHRIGRSGRFGKRGIAFNMVADEKDLAIIKCIEEHFGRKIRRVDVEDLDQLEEIGN